MSRLTRLTSGAGFALSTDLVMGCSSTPSGDQSTAEPPSESSSAAPGEGITGTRADEHQPAAGDADFFSGDVTVDELFGATDDSTATAGRASFEAGARTAWHTHPAGQRLIITEGSGWVQEWGQERQSVAEGDVVWLAPGVKHWHGATATSPMTHIAVQDMVDDASVEWLEQAYDDKYSEEN